MRVILFRTPAPGDTYVSALAEAGYSAASIPALGETLLPSELEGIIARGAGAWEAAIITSRRAAEAWVLAAESCSADLACDWSAIPVWSPGPAVQSVFLRSSLPDHLLLRPAPTAISAAALAPLILAAPPRPRSGGAESRPGYRPYLILTGDKTLPLLTDTLRRAGRTVERVRVYETCEDAALAEAVASFASASSKTSTASASASTASTSATSATPGPSGAVTSRAESLEETVWLAFFSPSSAGFVLPHLERAGGLRGRTRVLAIGETTEAALRDCGWRVDAVARTPDAPGLVAAIVEADAK